MLLELSRRLGDEIRVPGARVSLLADCLAAGVENFYRRKGRYHPATWDSNVFLHFFQGVFIRAAAVFACRVQAADGGSWEVESLPYLDWRLEHPGAIEMLWGPPSEAGGQAGRLGRLILGARHYPCAWLVEQLWRRLGDRGHGR